MRSGDCFAVFYGLWAIFASRVVTATKEKEEAVRIRGFRRFAQILKRRSKKKRHNPRRDTKKPKEHEEKKKRK